MDSPSISFESTWVASALGPCRTSEMTGKSHTCGAGFSRIHTDSRSCTTGDLFIALKGERVDGHDFLSQALSLGAKGLVVDLKHPQSNVIRQSLPQDVCLFEGLAGPDPTLLAFRELAKNHRNRLSIPVVAIAGAVGKTTTKEFLAAILSGKFKNVLKTQGSQNGFVGVPMTILQARLGGSSGAGLGPIHDVAVIEIGIDECGAMEQHMQLVRPTHACVTAIAEEHLEHLKDLKTVAFEETRALTETLKSGGIIAINIDDPWLAQYLPELKSLAKRSEQILTYSGAKTSELESPLLGSHHTLNLNAALTLARALGLNDQECERGLSAFKGAAYRSEIHQSETHTFICDFYNASPASMRGGIEILRDLKQTSIRVACLGDMLELGPDELLFHAGLAKELAAAKVKSVYLYGSRMKALEAELHKSYPEISVYHSMDKTKLALELKQVLAQNENVGLLIKGSRGMKLEDIWNAIKPA